MSELIDRQAFIENERKLYCEDCDRRKGKKNGKPNVICYEIGEAPCRVCWLYDALDDLEDFPVASQWRRVEEKPKEADQYFVIWENNGDRGGGAAWFSLRLGWIWGGPKITHWMPIELPKEEK